ncbi:MAG: hypothetical protein DRH33_03615 [Candidatus Nealsonbacteria bacterium]|nr:MAG: hypothetical protein DRH33_03615 [Candidatus Nealsonbacteria bacterium]
MNKKDKIYQVLPITKRADGSTIGIPMVKITGQSSGPTLLLTAGVHGDEPEGVRSCLDLISQLDSDQIHGTVLVVPVVNVAAYSMRKRGNSLDDFYYDLNRQFPGSQKGTFTQRLAYKLAEEIFSQADLIVDIHSGGSNIYCARRSIINKDSEENLQLASALGPGWDFISKGAGTRKKINDLTNTAAQMGIPAITIENGGINGRLPDLFNKNVYDNVVAIKNVMKAFNMIDGKPLYSDRLLVMDYEPIMTDNGGLIIFEQSCRIGKEVKKGEKIITVTDYFDNIFEVIEAPYDGILLAIPAQVVLPQGCQIGSIGKIIRRIKPKRGQV